jgi:hypothetical protein
MQASSLTRLKRGLVIRDWSWWELPPVLRWYVAGVLGLALADAGFFATHTQWHLLTWRNSFCSQAAEHSRWPLRHVLCMLFLA